MSSIELTSTVLEQLSTERPQQEFYDRGFHAGGSFGVRVAARGTKAFFLIYQLPGGKRRRMTLGRYPVTSLNRAREIALEMLRLVAEGRDPAAESRSYPVNPTFAELVEVFKSERVSKRLSGKTSREYQRIFERELLPCWGYRSMRDISPQEVSALYHAIANERGSGVMAARVNSLLNTVFSFAQKRGWLKENPCDHQKLHTPRETAHKTIPKAELRELWRYLVKEQTLSSCVLRLMLLTAQKPGVVCSMRWEDVRFERWIVNKKDRESLPGRSLYLPIQARETLRDALSLSGVRDYVFPSRGDTHISHIRKAANRACGKLGFGSKWSPMDIHRSIPRYLRAEGIKPYVIDSLLGINPEARGQAIEDIYFDEVRDALQLWASILTEAKPIPPTERGKVIQLFPPQNRRKL